VIRYHPCLVLDEGLQISVHSYSLVRLHLSSVLRLQYRFFSLYSSRHRAEISRKIPSRVISSTHLCAFRSSLRTLPFTAGIIFPFPTLILSNPHALTAIAAPTRPPRPTRRMHLPMRRSMATTASALRLARNLRVDSPPLGRMTAAIAARRTV